MMGKNKRLFLFLVIGVAFAFSATLLWPESTAQKIDTYIQKWVNAKQFSGSILVARRGKIVLSKGYGMANYEFSVPNTPKTKFHIGSVTKQFTAMAIMILVKDGKLKLSDSIATVFPDYPNGEKITIHNLLTHTSGIPNYTDFPEFQKIKCKSTTIANLIDLFKNKPLVFEPGSKYEYSNSGYVLLGAVIEKLSGKSYPQFMQEYIFKPLQMNDSGVITHEAIIKDLASGYTFKNGKREDSPFTNHSVMMATGGIYSTVKDMYKWDRSLYTEKLLPKKLRAELFTPYLNNYALGWRVENRGGHKLVWHSGEYADCVAVILRYVEDDVCIIILSNIDADHYDLRNLMAPDIAALVFGKTPEWDPKEHIAIVVNPKVYDAYVGTYKVPIEDTSMTFVITKERDDLFATTDKIEYKGTYKHQIYPETKNHFFYKDLGLQITFVKGKGGIASKMIFHAGGRQFEGERITNQKESGVLSTEDKLGNPVLFEWETISRKDFGQKVKPLADILSKTFTEIELQKFKVYPKDIKPVIDFLAGNTKTFEELVLKGVVTVAEKSGAVKVVKENAFKEVMTELLKSYVLVADKSLPEEYKQFIFLNVKDKKTAELIGCGIFVIQDDNSVYIWNMTLKPEAQGRGLGKLLASSIFKILPDTKKIDLGVYSTNTNAIRAYKYWDFVEEPSDEKGFRSIHMEYFVDKSDVLQKAAEKIK